MSPDQLFDLTETIAKDKNYLPWFFWCAQKTIRDQLMEARSSSNDSRSRRLEFLYDLSLQTERDLIQRYGNTTLGLDRFLVEWLS